MKRKFDLEGLNKMIITAIFVSMEHLPKGTHYLIDLFDCDAVLLNDKAYIEKAVLEAAKLAGTTILHGYFHEFTPMGITGSVVIAESHINIHTWPEHSFAAIDVFTCGDNAFPKHASEHLHKIFSAQRMELKEIQRGFAIV